MMSLSIREAYEPNLQIDKIYKCSISVYRARSSSQSFESPTEINVKMDLRNKTGFERGSDEDFCCCAIPKASYQLENDPITQILTCTLEIPTSLTAILANLLIIISIWRTPSLHSPSHILLVGLAVSDLGVCLVLQPAFTAGIIAKISQRRFLFCASYGTAWVAGYFLCSVSILTLTAICLDRYIAISFHLRYQAIVTNERVIATLVAIGVASSCHSLLYALGITLITVILVVQSLSIVMFISCAIQHIVCRQQRQIAAQMCVHTVNRENRPLNIVKFKNSFTNMQILCVALLVCYLPCLVIHGIMFAEELTPSTQSAYEISVLLAHLNSTLNPFLYCWRYKLIREAVVKNILEIIRR